MNNNWLSFPLSPSHSSLPADDHDLQATQYHQFSLGLVHDNMENPFQNHHGMHIIYSLSALIYKEKNAVLNVLNNCCIWSIV